MKIRLISDVHFEFFEDVRLFQSQGEDVLVIAGDLAVGPVNVFNALKRFSNTAKDVVYIPGNHEYYGHTIEAFDGHIRAAFKDSNVHFLNPGFVQIGDVKFIGAALWTNFRGRATSKLMAKGMISDFRAIKEFSGDVAEGLFYQHKKFIFNEYANTNSKCVIVTHFLPAIQCISAQYKRDRSGLNDYFANDLGLEIESLENATWLFGHTHDRVDTVIGNTRLVCNPYGYYQNHAYPNLIIEV